MAQVNKLVASPTGGNPRSPQNFNEWHVQRLQRAWLYKGPDAAKNHRLTTDQAWYAITLRRQLAERLLREAPPPVKAPTWSDGWQHTFEWNTIRTALRREITRCMRADKRLAAKAVHA